MHLALACILLTLGLSACAGTPASGSATCFRSIARGYQTGLAPGTLTVARDAEEWRRMWERHASNVIPRPDLPAVDFASEMVVCVTLDDRPTYGYAVEIARVVDLGHDLRVDVVERAPLPDAIANPIVTRPFHMIATARRSGEVRRGKP